MSLSTQVYKMGTGNILLGVTLLWTSIPSRVSSNTFSCFMLQKPSWAPVVWAFLPDVGLQLFLPVIYNRWMHTLPWSKPVLQTHPQRQSGHKYSSQMVEQSGPLTFLLHGALLYHLLLQCVFHGWRYWELFSVLSTLWVFHVLLCHCLWEKEIWFYKKTDWWLVLDTWKLLINN